MAKRLVTDFTPDDPLGKNVVAAEQAEQREGEHPGQGGERPSIEYETTQPRSELIKVPLTLLGTQCRPVASEGRLARSRRCED